MLGEGYNQLAIEMLERWSAGSGPDFGSGYTHTPNGPNDHYWRLIVAEGVWYFQYVDYSPRNPDELIPSQGVTYAQYAALHGEPYIRDDPSLDI